MEVKEKDDRTVEMLRRWEARRHRDSLRARSRNKQIPRANTLKPIEEIRRTRPSSHMNNPFV